MHSHIHIRVQHSFHIDIHVRIHITKQNEALQLVIQLSIAQANNLSVFVCVE